MKRMVAIVALLPGLVLAENLIRNADMSESSRWRGARGNWFMEHEGTRVMAIPAHRTRDITVSQPFRTRKVGELVARIRYRSDDYAGSGFKFQLNYGRSQTWITERVRADGEWHVARTTFTAHQATAHLDLEIILMKGEGTVYIAEVLLAEPDSEAVREWDATYGR